MAKGEENGHAIAAANAAAAATAEERARDASKEAWPRERRMGTRLRQQTPRPPRPRRNEQEMLRRRHGQGRGEWARDCGSKRRGRRDCGGTSKRCFEGGMAKGEENGHAIAAANAAAAATAEERARDA